MKRQLVIPTNKIDEDLLIYGQFLGFDIVKVTSSLFGNKRFHLKKNQTSFCLEEHEPNDKQLSMPYLEVVVSSERECRQLIDEITVNSKIKAAVLHPNEDVKPLLITHLQNEAVLLKIICDERIDILPRHLLNRKGYEKE